MFIPETFNDQLDDLLIRICEKLQISETQHKQAEDRYGAVGKWLSQNDSALSEYNPLIYPQGSLQFGTTVRPLAYQEYDVDLVCELKIDHEKSDPVAVLNAIEGRLKENKTYQSMIEKKNRCVRLNYANEFHMDILPGCPNGGDKNGKLKVPDRELQEWKDSNPKGYAAWFQGKVELYKATVIKAAAENVEPFPAHEPLERKLPLKRTVQLIKRCRDISFKNDEKSAPISIVLTTLAGHYYVGQISVNEALKYTLNRIVTDIPSDRRLVVLNPTNMDEDLSERWDNEIESYLKFVKWVNEFNSAWETINKAHGIQNIAKILKEMFGETVTDEALKEQTRIIESARKQNLLGVAAGAGILSSKSRTNSIPVKKNTFYGV
jgi:hypothetical protein